MELLFSIIGAVTGIVGMLAGLAAWFRYRMDAVVSYFDYDKNPEYIEARRAVHEMEKGVDIDSELGGKIAMVILTFNTNALLVRKWLLPYWVFSNTPAMYACINFYEKLEQYIILRREDNPLYANEFEWLYKEILRKNKHIEWPNRKK